MGRKYFQEKKDIFEQVLDYRREGEKKNSKIGKLCGMASTICQNYRFLALNVYL